MKSSPQTLKYPCLGQAHMTITGGLRFEHRDSKVEKERIKPSTQTAVRA